MTTVCVRFGRVQIPLALDVGNWRAPNARWTGCQCLNYAQWLWRWERPFARLLCQRDRLQAYFLAPHVLFIPYCVLSWRKKESLPQKRAKKELEFSPDGDFIGLGFLQQAKAEWRGKCPFAATSIRFKKKCWLGTLSHLPTLTAFVKKHRMISNCQKPVEDRFLGIKMIVETKVIVTHRKVLLLVTPEWISSLLFYLSFTSKNTHQSSAPLAWFCIITFSRLVPCQRK